MTTRVTVILVILISATLSALSVYLFIDASAKAERDRYRAELTSARTEHDSEGCKYELEAANTSLASCEVALSELRTNSSPPQRPNSASQMPPDDAVVAGRRDTGPWESADFRKVKWGDSKTSVLRTEPTKPEDQSDTRLLYTGKLGGLEAYTVYYFVQDKLVRGKYQIAEKHSYKNKYISDFEDLKKLLVRKHGAPKRDETFWNNDLYKDDSSSWGTAVSIGYLSFYTVWDNPTSKIILALSGDNYEISLAIEYSSKEHEGLETKERERSTLDDL